MAEPMAHRLAGRYEVRSLIGRGGMAEVHLGFDTRLSRDRTSYRPARRWAMGSAMS